MKAHQSQWDQLLSARQKKRLSQALLFVGSKDAALPEFSLAFIQMFFCEQAEEKPCLHCGACQRVAKGEHPDLVWIKPEKNLAAIKIDQIRSLQEAAYLTPYMAAQRIVVIEAAHKMNTAAANALLKILEEPPAHTFFILIAEQIGTVLPTILSRCQIHRFSAPSCSHNLLSEGAAYSPESGKALCIAQAEFILDELIALIELKKHPCTVALDWQKYELDSLLGFLYLVYAQLQFLFFGHPLSLGPAMKQLMHLKSLLNPVLVFKQIDKINSLIKKQNLNIHFNQSLALESLLCSLGDLSC